jgi:hypothetical protein
MTTRQKVFCVLVIFGLCCLSSCNLPWGTTSISQDTDTPTGDQQTQVALSVEQTLNAGVADIPQFTDTPEYSPTPSSPMITVSVETNCRTGPGTVYDILGVLRPGQTAEVIGRNSSGDTWIIELPSNPSVTCWLWGYYATVTGDTTGLTVFTPPPTPTAVASFTYQYRNWGVGPGYQCLMFDVTNTGGVPWESYSMSIHDISHGDTGTSQSEIFVDYDGWCSSLGTQLNLNPGQTGIASVIMFMVHNPSGDHFEVTLKLCSGDSLTGVCETKNITFIF